VQELPIPSRKGLALYKNRLAWNFPDISAENKNIDACMLSIDACMLSTDACMFSSDACMLQLTPAGSSSALQPIIYKDV
jgi:hypothetical protein